MKLVLLLLITSTNAFAFFGPQGLRCKSTDRIQILGSAKKQMFPPGQNKFSIQDVSVLKVYEKKTVIAKLYPRAGIESVVLSKSHRIETDQHNYWNVVRLSGTSVISCEILND